MLNRFTSLSASGDAPAHPMGRFKIAAAMAPRHPRFGVHEQFAVRATR
jgi:hypothetical protein